MTADIRSDPDLHLPNLIIEGFGGIEKLRIPRLARVTLLAGKNGVGKTTALDAVRVYAARGNVSVIRDILDERDEFSENIDEDGNDLLDADWSALFHGRNVAHARKARIGRDSQVLTIEWIELNKDLAEKYDLLTEFLKFDNPRIIRSSMTGYESVVFSTILSVHKKNRYNATRTVHGAPDKRDRIDQYHGQLKCEKLGPGLLSGFNMGAFWRNVALTDGEDRLIEALRIVLGEEVDRITVVAGDPPFRQATSGIRVYRRPLVRLKGHSKPVPLKSCGDGASRSFGVALAMANCADGFLLIDEAENGLHWSVQRDFWRMVLKTARENNVQVIATTHGYDSITGFAKAMGEAPEEDGLLIRLEQEDGETRPIEYTKEELATVAEQRIEVR